jgi:hypothetical protein
LGYKMVLTNTFRQFDPYTVAVGKIITWQYQSPWLYNSNSSTLPRWKAHFFKHVTLIMGVLEYMHKKLTYKMNNEATHINKQHGYIMMAMLSFTGSLTKYKRPV